MTKTIRVGARGSALSLRQTEEVIALLAKIHKDVCFEVVKVETPAEQMPDRPVQAMPGTGQFTRTLEDRLMSKDIDLAVHSAKDLPTQLGEGLVVGAVPAREDPRDALISAKERRLEGLPEGSTVGTGSPRRVAQILRLRRDLRPVLVRGNLDTRLKKLERGEVDALVVAVAGLNRMGWETTVTEILEPRIMMPAGGQGALIVEARALDEELIERVARIDHLPSRMTVLAERATLSHLAAGCHLPVGVLAVSEDGDLRMSGRILSVDGSQEVSYQVSGRQRDAESVGKRLAKKLLKKDGKKIVASWNAEIPKS